MIDIRALVDPADPGTASMLPFVPSSIADDPDIIAMSLALAPQFSNLTQSIVEAIVLPRIGDLSAPVCDALAWGYRLNELSFWDDLPVEGKRIALAGILKVLKCAGTTFAVARIFDILQIEGQVIPWFDDAAPPSRYRLHVEGVEGSHPSGTRAAIIEWAYRLGPTRGVLTGVTFA